MSGEGVSIEVEGGGLVSVSQVKDGYLYTHLCHMASGQVLDAEVQPEPVHVADKVLHKANDAKRVAPSAALTAEDFTIHPDAENARAPQDVAMEVARNDYEASPTASAGGDVAPVDDSAELLKLASTIPTDGEAKPAPSAPPADAPKRRGRPPKVRPAE